MSPRRPTHNVGKSGAKSSVSQTRAKSAFSLAFSLRIYAAMDSPPTSSSPSKITLPLNVKVIFEGEEEVGGESIAAYMRKEKAKLKADFALVCDTELFAPDLPTLCVGLRGLIYTEIEAKGAMTDLHSGMYGGAAPNPFFALIEVISRLKDAKGKILIPGFYSKVKAPTKDELKA